MPVKSFRKKLEMAKDSRVEASSRRSENSTAFILNWSCFKWITLMTRRWQLPLWFLLFSSSFPKSACPTQALRRLWCFCRFSKFFLTWKLGVALAMSTDDRFLPQGKQTLPKICQVRPMPLLFSKLNVLFASKNFLVFFIRPILLKLGMEEKDPSTKVRTKKRKIFSGVLKFSMCQSKNY